MTRGLINRILPFSSVDGPGNRTVIFLQGCNFNCLYCHNPETIDRKVNGNNIYLLSVDEVMNIINKSKSFISGITVSGGECTLQIKFLEELFEKIKSTNLTTFLDTNGSILLSNHKKLIQNTDKVMIDLKSYNNEEHIMLTGSNNDNIIKNINELSKLNKIYEIRTVIVPNLLKNSYNVNKISKLIASLDPNIRYKIIKFRDKGVRKELIKSNEPSKDYMDELYTIAVSNGCNNVIRV